MAKIEHDIAWRQERDRKKKRASKPYVKRTGHYDHTRGWDAYRHNSRTEKLPQPLPTDPNQKLVEVFVEGYEDVAFWRAIFDRFRTPYLRFEISVPNRIDLPKGKKVLLGMVPQASEHRLLCMDSDFDYLFEDATAQSRTVNHTLYLFHTFAYATENFLCYAPSLHNVCVKATKNDTRIFDFVRFMAEYSRTIYPLFVWYAYSASLASEHIFTLAEFRTSVRLPHVEIENNGALTLERLSRGVQRREEQLCAENPQMIEPMKAFETLLSRRGVTPENVYLYMHGHTLMDNVVMMLLNAVCEKLRALSIAKIVGSSKEGQELRNEMANYTHALRPVRDVLLDNENYTECPLYRRLQQKLLHYVTRTVVEMKRRGEITDNAHITVLRHLHEKNL